MKSLARLALVCGPLAVAACDGSTSATIASLEARVAGLERRSGRPIAVSPAGADASGAGDVFERLDADLHSLERRLADVEAEVALLRDAVGTDDLGGPAGDDARRDRRSDRRQRMRTLTAAYRDKLAEVRRQYREDPADPGRQRALRDVVDWYRSERRAAMRGE